MNAVARKVAALPGRMLRAPRRLVGRLLEWPALNFALTNRIPRRSLTRLAGRVARIRHPLVSRPSIALWRFFADVDLRDAGQARYASLHDAFTRELRAGARPLDADARAILSPCDGVVGALGRVEQGLALQAKGHSYPLAELLLDAALAAEFEGGQYATLRLTAGMYHRFHAPADCVVEGVQFVAGDVWNVNPPALQRVPGLYCRNERAIVQCRLADGARMLLVPVAAVLVASLKLHCLQERLHLRYRGPSRIRCRARYERGAELGWFEQGSTIIVLMPPRFRPAEGIATGARVRMGRALYRPAVP
jgi:phosphatidylserine decarboxylase